MLNPNKIHSVEKTVFKFEESGAEITTRAVINQEDQEGNISILYQIDKIMDEKSDNTIGQPHMITLYYPPLQAKKNTPLNWKEKYITIDNYVNRIRKYFKRGRVLFSSHVHAIPDLKHRSLSYKQVKAILRFENRAARRLNDKPEAIRFIDPTKIKDVLNLDQYAIESWSRGFDKHSYTSITMNTDMDAWLSAMQMQNY